jgi:hypothetical protein
MAWLESIKRTIERTREGWRHWRTFREIDEGHRYQSRYHFPTSAAAGKGWHQYTGGPSASSSAPYS